MEAHEILHESTLGVTTTSLEAVHMTGGRDMVAKTEGSIIFASKVCRHVDSADGQFAILDEVDLEVREGECVAIIGPSGCGKTMFLNMVAGLERYDSGTILVRGAPPIAGQPGSAYAFARDGLVPWKDALGNVELALALRGVNKEEQHTRALEALSRVGLADASHRYRSQLSQGMRQRVALARTFVTRPNLLLLDEPFAALDAQTRIAMQDLLLELLSEFSGTVLLVTHDLGEALTLADRVVLFSRRPASVKHEYEVDLPRTRGAGRIRSDSRYQRLYENIWNDLGEEVGVK